MARTPLRRLVMALASSNRPRRTVRGMVTVLDQTQTTYGARLKVVYGVLQ